MLILDSLVTNTNFKLSNCSTNHNALCLGNEKEKRFTLYVLINILKQRVLEEVIEEPQPVVEEEEQRVTNFNIPIKEIEKRFRALLKLIDVLVVLDCDHNHLGPFLGDVIDEFRQESRVRRRREGEEVEVTLHDRLLFIREVENGDLCWKIYKMWKRRGHNVTLGTLMVIYILREIL